MYRPGLIEPSLHVPDGTEFKTGLKFGNRFRVNHGDGNYEVEIAHFAEETAESIAERKKSKSRSGSRWLIQIAKTAVFVGLLVFMYKRNKTRSKKYYQAYYDKKRSEFAWLDNWLKGYPDIAADRAGEDSGFVTIFTIVAFIVSYLIAAFFIKSRNVGEIVMIALPVVFCELLGLYTIRKKGQSTYESEKGLKLECPSCSCPHSYWMLQKENIVESEETTTETIKREGYGKGDFFDSALEGFKKDGTEKNVTVVYAGRSIKDFKCANCGHTEHNEYNERWVNSRPADEGKNVYNPPKMAWEPTAS